MTTPSDADLGTTQASITQGGTPVTAQKLYIQLPIYGKNRLSPSETHLDALTWSQYKIHLDVSARKTGLLFVPDTLACAGWRFLLETTFRDEDEQVKRGALAQVRHPHLLSGLLLTLIGTPR